MPVISQKTTIAANAQSGNVIAQSPYEFISVPSAVLFALTCSGDGVVADIQLGGEALAQGALVSTANRFPQFDDDMLLRAGGIPGERIFLNLRNTTAGPLDVFSLIGIFPT